MSSDADKLRAARELIARPGGWIQNESAKDANGFSIEPEDKLAACFCMTGALDHVGYSRTAAFWLKEATGVSHLPGWNDFPNRTQAEVISAFDEAIALAEASHV